MLFRSTPTDTQLNAMTVERSTSGSSILRNVSMYQSFVEALGHGLIGDEITLAQISRLGNQKNGIKSRFGHPGMSEDGTGKQVGSAFNFRVRDDKVVGDIRFLESARISPKFANDPVEYILKMAEERPEDFGMSIVFSGHGVWVLENGEEVKHDPAKDRPENALNELPIIRLESLKAVDFVDEPASNRDGLFHALSHGYTVKHSEEMFSKLDEVIEELGWDTRKAYQFCMRYFYARGEVNDVKKPKLSYRNKLKKLTGV